MCTTHNSYALVTGASKGLGKALATELAKRKINILLVSLAGENLPKLAKELSQQYAIDAIAFETDLSVVDNVMDLSEYVNKNYDIFILINNAGIGGTYDFQKVSHQLILKIIQLNVTATSLLTHQLLPNLMRQTQSYILNVSSIAAFTPVGFKTVYPASKSFVHSFSRGLNAELRNSKVFVSVVNPGAMKTSPEIIARINRQGFLGKLVLQEIDAVAKRCIDRLFRKDSVIMVNPLSWVLLSLIPIWIKLPLMTRAIKRELR